jgi:hypothetical protein
MTAAEDKARIKELEAELAKARAGGVVEEHVMERPPVEERVVWKQTMRGEQPYCKSCATHLTRGPQGGLVEAECPSCHTNLRDGNNGAAVESRSL